MLVNARARRESDARRTPHATATPLRSALLRLAPAPAPAPFRSAVVHAARAHRVRAPPALCVQRFSRLTHSPKTTSERGTLLEIRPISARTVSSTIPNRSTQQRAINDIHLCISYVIHSAERPASHIVAHCHTLGQPTTEYGRGHMLRWISARTYARMHVRYVERKERAAQLREGAGWGRGSARRSKGGRDAHRDVRKTDSGRACSRLVSRSCDLSLSTDGVDGSTSSFRRG